MHAVPIDMANEAAPMVILWPFLLARRILDALPRRLAWTALVIFPCSSWRQEPWLSWAWRAAARRWPDRHAVALAAPWLSPPRSCPVSIGAAMGLAAFVPVPAALFAPRAVASYPALFVTVSAASVLAVVSLGEVLLHRNHGTADARSPLSSPPRREHC
ncbi:hypothetical protein NG819_09235 [Pseudarthrobacter sp. Fe7]|nr:hypothetical protein NG819_09235 [Pseudarthrobacter sp. Fe7]